MKFKRYHTKKPKHLRFARRLCLMVDAWRPLEGVDDEPPMTAEISRHWLEAA